MPSWAKINVCNWLTIMENDDFQSWKVMEKSWKMKFPGLWQPCSVTVKKCIQILRIPLFNISGL